MKVVAALAASGNPARSRMRSEDTQTISGYRGLLPDILICTRAQERQRPTKCPASVRGPAHRPGVMVPIPSEGVMGSTYQL